MRVQAIGAALLLALTIGACSNDDDVARDAASSRSEDTAETTTTDASTVGDADTATGGEGADTTTTSSARRSTTTSAKTTTGGGATNTTSGTATGSNTTATTAAGATTTGEPFQSQSALKIQGRRFDPSDLGVNQRTRVTVTNADAETHTWTSDSGEWNSGRIVAGGSFTHSFTRVGAFAYHCEIHPSMAGSVTVN